MMRDVTTPFRRLDALDRLLSGAERALASTAGSTQPAQQPYPAQADDPASFSDAERRHAAGLMRVNHAGEVCAQALYLGQAAVARTPELRAHLRAAAAEEADHLAWCVERLGELGDRPSLLNPLWFAGSFAIGAVAGLAGDRRSLGFIVETERQVEAHLGDHLESLPAADQRSREVVRRMQADEARHGRNARQAGASDLPEPVPRLMALTAAIMKWAAYRL
jgi:ubiquinone biosynthesis monooxygenase Coq7